MLRVGKRIVLKAEMAAAMHCLRLPLRSCTGVPLVGFGVKGEFLQEVAVKREYAAGWAEVAGAGGESGNKAHKAAGVTVLPNGEGANKV